MLETNVLKQNRQWVLYDFEYLEMSSRTVGTTRRVRQKLHLLNGIDIYNIGKFTLSNWFYRRKKVAKMNLQISTGKIYCKTTNYKG